MNDIVLKEQNTATAQNAAVSSRPALFISHATPEGNEFTIWLGAHLSAAGYEVWADVLKLTGGNDWARKLESALRDRACKVLLVATATSVEKQGVRNEIQIASDVSKKIKDPNFIIPLRLEDYQSPFLIVQAQYIDFKKGWGKGLAELLLALKEYGVPCSPSENSENIDLWRATQLRKSQVLQHEAESLISNWLKVSEWPSSINYFQVSGAMEEGQMKNLLDGLSWPNYPHARGFYTFASASDLYLNGQLLPFTLTKSSMVGRFLESGDIDRSVGMQEARNVVSSLLRRAFDKKLRDKQLSPHSFADGYFSWWVHSGLINGDKVAFEWTDGPSGRRQLVGESEKKKVRWHFGISHKPWFSPFAHIRVLPRVLFSEDGKTLIPDVKKLHRLRRSIPKSWRNEKWRDMLLAFLFWLSDGKNFIKLEVGSNAVITVDVPPVMLTSPVSIKLDEEKTESEDEESDDPVLGYDNNEYEDDEEVPSE